jgi:agmatinase
MRRLHGGGPLTVVGVRSYSAGEAEYAAAAADVRLVPARAVTRDGASARDFVAALGPEVYVTVDVDGLDPSVVPATGTPEPGGLAWWDVLDLLRELFAARRVVGMDVVELAPVPTGHRSEFAVARLVAKMLSYRALAGARAR